MEGFTVREVVGPASGSAVNQSLIHAVVDAGAASVEHLHRRTEEVVWVLSGTARVRIDGAPQELAEGDCVVIAPGARHKLFNTGDAPLVLLACCSPAFSPDDTEMTE